MKREMIEALRLTREGRLKEAKALVEQALGLGDTSSAGPARAARGHVVEPQRLPGAPESDSSSGKTEAATAGAAEAEPKVPQEGTIPPRIRVEPPPTPRFTPPRPKPLGGQVADVLAKLAARRPAGRQIPAEAIAPAAGRWVTGSYTGPPGTRGYKAYLPSWSEEQPMPLLVMLHGCTQDADDFAAGTRMNFLAETAGFLVVYPEQAAAANTSRCWNWFQANDQRRDGGEPSLIAGITRQIVAEYRADAERVYVAGLSAGGAMAAIMAATYPDVYAGVAVHSGLAPGSAHDLPSALQAMQQGKPGAGAGGSGRTTPLILFQGDKDSTVHPRNADELVRHWISEPGPASKTTREGQVPGGRAYTCASYQDSSGRVVVERWTVHGASHAWAGGSTNGSFTDPAGPNASAEMVRFFGEHPRAKAESPPS